jgi:hypothetical protein
MPVHEYMQILGSNCMQAYRYMTGGEDLMITPRCALVADGGIEDHRSR